MKSRLRKKIVQKILNSNGRFFSVVFTKRTTGARRVMNCKVNNDDLDRALASNLIPVIEITGNGTQYRVIPIEGIRFVKLNKKQYGHSV